MIKTREHLVRLLKASLFGAVLLTFLDSLQLKAGVLAYTSPAMWKMAWHVPVQFGILTFFLALVFKWLEDRYVLYLSFDHIKAKIVGETLLFGCVYAATAILLPAGSGLIALLLFGLLAVRLTVFGGHDYVIFAGFLAIFGSLLEIGVIEFGTYKYAQDDILGIPVWLPAFWANGAFLMRNLFTWVSSLKTSCKD